MAVLDDIRTWMAGRAKWEQHAFDLVYQTPALPEDSIDDLVRRCLEEVGVPRPKAAKSAQDNGQTDAPLPKVTLGSVENVANINSLAPNQTLQFEATGLTVVYGDNGAGKTGYNRILKQACRARGKKPELLGNIYQPAAGNPSATIRYAIDGVEQPPAVFAPKTPLPAALGQISIFDAEVATAQVRENNDVSFRPFGLDLLDHLAKAMERMKEKLRLLAEAEEDSTFDATPYASVPEFHAVLTDLKATDAAEKVEALATPLSKEDEARIAQLEAIIAEAKANDPKALAVAYRAKSGRFSVFKDRIIEINASCGEANLARLRGVKAVAAAAVEASIDYRTKVMEGQPLAGVGTETWSAMWEAAKLYSQSEAYKAERPSLAENPKCVLCAQDLTPDARSRFEVLEKFVEGELQKKAATAKAAVKAEETAVASWVFSKAEDAALLKEIEAADAACHAGLKEGVDRAVKFKVALLEYLRDKGDAPSPLSIDEGGLTAICDSINEKLKQVEETSAAGNVDKEKAELGKLIGRRLLVTQKKAILAEIERIKKHAKLLKGRSSINTTGISGLGSSLTAKYVSEELKAAFEKERQELGLPLPLKLTDQGARRGVLMQRIELASVQKASIEEVISEGEHRCTALASFLTEVSTTGSGLIFDDPVCSLDHNWRESISRRLVDEAAKRQVIVFTHDIVFLVALKDAAGESGVAAKYRSIVKRGANSGYCEDAPPWKALKVNDRLGALSRELSDLKKGHASGDAGYEKNVRHWYGLLRETWECAIEELLLNGAVERFRNSIETKRLERALKAVKVEDYPTISSAMGRCSTFLPGHDKGKARNLPVPTPGDADGDLKVIRDWVATKRSSLS